MGNSFQVARQVVPHLKRVFQADSCHMSVGKYTLYLCHGTTANCNTFPIAFGMIFGNKDKDGWVQFWNFVMRFTHPLTRKTQPSSRMKPRVWLSQQVKCLLKRSIFIVCFIKDKTLLRLSKGGMWKNLVFGCSTNLPRLTQSKKLNISSTRNFGMSTTRHWNT